jgi:hypothetical protein
MKKLLFLVTFSLSFASLAHAERWIKCTTNGPTTGPDTYDRVTNTDKTIGEETWHIKECTDPGASTCSWGMILNPRVTMQPDQIGLIVCQQIANGNLSGQTYFNGLQGIYTIENYDMDLSGLACYLWEVTGYNELNQPNIKILISTGNVANP